MQESLFNQEHPNMVMRWPEWRELPLAPMGAQEIHQRMIRTGGAKVVEERHALQAIIRVYETPPRDDHPAYLIPVFFTRVNVAFCLNIRTVGTAFTWDQHDHMQEQIDEVLKTMALADGTLN